MKPTPILQSALRALECGSLALCEELLREAIEQVQGYQEEAHRARLLIPTLPEDPSAELCAMLVGD
jgi:hypothetical protein